MILSVYHALNLCMKSKISKKRLTSNFTFYTLGTFDFIRNMDRPITFTFPSKCVREHQIANYTSRDKVASQETDRNGSHNELLNLIVYIRDSHYGL